MSRCFGDGDALYAAYHDEEWGRPVTDERGLYERLTLEAFQSGLSWLTILRKRDAFRSAFADFDPERVARFGERDRARLLSDAAIVRNAAKIDAAIANARATLHLRDTGPGLPELVWSHRPAVDAAGRRSLGETPAASAESRMLARELKRLGFRFVGPTTAYSLMQACGIVNDHLAHCPVRETVQRDRERVSIPEPASSV